MKNFKKIVLVSTLALSSMSMFPYSETQQASASELNDLTVLNNDVIYDNFMVASNTPVDVNLLQVNNSTLQLDIMHQDVVVDMDENGVVTLINGENSEVLPTTAIDVNGNSVNLVYKEIENDLLVELHSTTPKIQVYKLSDKVKCAIGTAGGWIGGGLLGGGTGIAAGTVWPGVGNVAGGIGGAIGGGMTGAATFF